MKKALWINAALLAVVVALAWFAHVAPRHDGPPEYPLSALKVGTVKHVRIERKGRQPIVLERKGSRWFLTSPFAARAEEFNVWRLLAILNAKASSRLPPKDLSRFDLDRPNTRLTVAGQTFSFGMVNTVAQEQYVMTHNMVYTVPARYGTAFPSSFTQLIARRLFASDEVPVGFELENFAVRMSGKKWVVVPVRDKGQRAGGTSSSGCGAALRNDAKSFNSPSMAHDCTPSSERHADNSGSLPTSGLSQDDINRWVDNWRHASALRAAPFAHGKPVGEITVELKGKKKFTLAILQRKPELVLLRRDENLVYDFVAETAKRLLQPPAAKD